MNHHPALAVDGLARTYGEGPGAVRALDGVDLAFERGTFTAVMGPSGSGKSTFLTCAAGLERPTERPGRHRRRRTSPTGTRTRRTRLRRERIGFVFQGFNLMPYLTAEQNVGLPLRLAGRRAGPAPGRARCWTGSASATAPGTCPAHLSGGQQQRVAIARALVDRPGRRPRRRADRRSRLHDAPATCWSCCATASTRCGQTVVMVTHDPVAASYADTVVFLVDGRVAGRMDQPTADAVAGQMAHLDDLVVAVAR